MAALVMIDLNQSATHQCAHLGLPPDRAQHRTETRRLLHPQPESKKKQINL